MLCSLSLDIREKCLDKGDALTLEKAINLGQIHESSQESLHVIGEDPKMHAVTEPGDGGVAGPVGRQVKVNSIGTEIPRSVLNVAIMTIIEHFRFLKPIAIFVRTFLGYVSLQWHPPS